MHQSRNIFECFTSFWILVYLNGRNEMSRRQEPKTKHKFLYISLSLHIHPEGNFIQYFHPTCVLIVTCT